MFYKVSDDSAINLSLVEWIGKSYNPISIMFTTSKTTYFKSFSTIEERDREFSTLMEHLIIY